MALFWFYFMFNFFHYVKLTNERCAFTFATLKSPMLYIFLYFTYFAVMLCLYVEKQSEIIFKLYSLQIKQAALVIVPLRQICK